MTTPWRIERLADVHDRSTFCCGQPSLDDFLTKLAGQYDRRDFARTYVAVRPPDLKVQGYYTLSGGALDLILLPEAVRKKLPRHQAPVACLGRLAVTQTAQGQKLGKLLLLDALKRCSLAGISVPWPHSGETAPAGRVKALQPLLGRGRLVRSGSSGHR
jgi:GNAT superfamily N-acetyltransferase